MEKAGPTSDLKWLDILNWLSIVMLRFETDSEQLTLAPISCNWFIDSLFNCCLILSHDSWQAVAAYPGISTLFTRDEALYSG